MRSRAVERDAVALARTQPQESIETIRVPLLAGGIRGDKAPIDLAPNEAVTIDALHVVAGRLVVDTGYTTLGDEVIGTPQREFQAIFDDGTSVVLLVTTTTVYTYYAPLDQWQYASWNQAYVTTATAVAGASAVALDAVTDLTIGTRIGITLVSGRQHKTVINNIVALNVAFDPPIPAGESVALGAAVVGAPVLAGDIYIAQVTIEVYPPLSYIVFCNGVDEIMYYADNVVQLLPGLPDPTVCKAIAVFHECLLIANLIEAGDERSGRVRMSDQGDPFGWDVGVDGIAAIYDLIDTDDPILVLKGLGPWLIAYREASIMKASYIGALFETLFWEYMLRADGSNDADGPQSQGAVVSIDASHAFVGHKGIWRYTGNYSLESIGDAVFNDFLSASGDFDSSRRGMLFCVYSAPLREFWILYPAINQPTASLAPNKMLRLSILSGGWTTRTFAHRMIGAGTYTPIVDIVLWSTARGAWNDPMWARAWNSRVFSENVPSIVFTSLDSARVFDYDYIEPSDNGVPVPWTIETGVYGDETIYSRWGDINMLGIGSEVTLEFSMDEGETWGPLGFINFRRGTTPRVEHRWIDRTSTRMQFRFTGTDPAFQLRRFSVAREQETEW